MNSIRSNNFKLGYVVIINTLFFLAISALVGYGVINPVTSSFRSTEAMSDSKQALLLANSATEEGLYRLKHGKQINSSENITLGNNTATIAIGDTTDGKIITVNGEVNDFVRTMQVGIIQGVGVTFNYGLQAGQGGFNLQGGSYIIGNVYSNGDINGNNSGSYITGSATVANASNPSAVVSHVGTIPPSYSVGFGEATYPPNTYNDFAQSFTVPSQTIIDSVKVYMRKSANEWKQNVELRITTDSSGKPSKTVLATGTLSASQVTTSFNNLTIQLTSTPTLNAGTTYWFVLDTESTWNARYEVASSNNTYSGGIAKRGTWASNNGGEWSNTSPSGLDAYFEIYAGGDYGTISGISVNGDAWAHEINNTIIGGTAYCQASNSNNKACNTSRPDPTSQPFPVSDGNIEEWKAVALAGGVHNGNLSYGSGQTSNLGPKKIVGNVDLSGGATLNVNGTLWITGNLNLNGGSKIKLGLGYGSSSGIVVVDGRVDNTGGGFFEGSGVSGSYIMVVSTSACPVGSCSNKPAIDVSGGSGAVVLNAQNGTIRFTGGAMARQLTAKTIELTGGSRVQYETGLADMSFSSQPSGTWNIVEWDEE